MPTFAAGGGRLATDGGLAGPPETGTRAGAGKGGAGEAPVVALEGVTRRFGEVVAVDDLSLSLQPGEFVTLLGPSGCGKTTALRLLAGFERADGGRITFRGEEITGWSPQRRGFGMVFQSYALFPHLDVFENVAFGLRSRKRVPPDLDRRVEAALARVDLAGYARRAVQALSGGQQQRVALARALAIEPPLLLLDEPLSNLDQALRVRTRGELRALVRELGITALFVTHDQEEAFALSDRIAVMAQGRLRQFGTPRELYEAPVDRFVAGFVGRVNELPARLEGAGDRARVAGVSWPVRLAGAAARAGGGSAGSGYLLVRPEALAMVDPGVPPASTPERTGPRAGGPTLPPLRARVVDRRFGGAVTTWSLVLEDAAGEAGSREADRGENRPMDDPPGSNRLEVVAPSGAGSGTGPDPRPGEVVGLVPRHAGACLFFADE
jgi:ABC-type Fe3+/spermidine/putrescine transport system ATPase subunit